MAFSRPFPAYPGLATTMFLGSSAGGATFVPSNANRVALTVQPLSDGFRVGPGPSLTGSSGLFIASGQITQLPVHAGALVANPNGGATAAIAVWESTS